MVQDLVPDGVLLDIALPLRDGFSVREHLLASPVTASIPVMVLTVNEELPNDFLRSVVAHLVKPVNSQRLNDGFALLDTAMKRRHNAVLHIAADSERNDQLHTLGERYSYDVSSVSSIAVSLETMQDWMPDIVLLDAQLCQHEAEPFAALQQLLQQAHYADVHKYSYGLVESEQALFNHHWTHLLETANDAAALLEALPAIAQPDKGSSQVMSRIADQPVVVPEQRPVVVGDSHAGAAPNLKGMNILIVDDDSRNIFSLTRMLTPCNVKIHVARNGKECIEQLRELPDIAAVLLDVMMPVMDGYECMQQIRSNPRTMHLAIVAITAKATPEDRDLCVSHGANGFVSKPIDKEQLYAEMCQVLERAAAA